MELEDEDVLQGDGARVEIADACGKRVSSVPVETLNRRVVKAVLRGVQSFTKQSWVQFVADDKKLPSNRMQKATEPFAAPLFEVVDRYRKDMDQCIRVLDTNTGAVGAHLKAKMQEARSSCEYPSHMLHASG